MAVIMISELPGAGPGFADVARQQGLFDKMKSAPGFMGHWSGATDTGYRVFEVWESPEAHQAWLDGTVKPSLPPRAEPVARLTSSCSRKSSRADRPPPGDR
jgi:hypothetical protein